jgi:hypothetical protein
MCGTKSDKLGYTPERSGMRRVCGSLVRRIPSMRRSVGPCESLHELLAGVKDEITHEQEDVEMGRVEPDFDNQIDDELIRRRRLSIPRK